MLAYIADGSADDMKLQNQLLVIMIRSTDDEFEEVVMVAPGVSVKGRALLEVLKRIVHLLSLDVQPESVESIPKTTSDTFTVDKPRIGPNITVTGDLARSNEYALRFFDKRQKSWGVFPSSDYPHLVKVLRNCLLARGLLYEGI